MTCAITTTFAITFVLLTTNGESVEQDPVIDPSSGETIYKGFCRQWVRHKMYGFIQVNFLTITAFS